MRPVSRTPGTNATPSQVERAVPTDPVAARRAGRRRVPGRGRRRRTTSAVSESSATSRSVSLIAASVRPRIPGSARQGRTAESRLGGGGSAGKQCALRGQRARHRPAAEEARERALRAPARSPSRARSGRWRARPRAARAGTAAPPAGVLDRRAQVVLALEQQHRHVRERPGAEPAQRRGRPALAELEHVARAARWRGRTARTPSRDAWPRPPRRAGAARPGRAAWRAATGSGDLLAGRGRVQRGAELARRRGLGVDLERAPRAAAASARRRRRAPRSTAPGKAARSAGSKSPATSIEKRSARV